MGIGTVRIHFSNGFGNNMFQYAFGRLLARHHKMRLNHPAIPQLGIKAKKNLLNKSIYTKTIGHSRKKPDTQYHKYFKKFNTPRNICTYGFFEDYTLYYKYLSRIKGWFPTVEVTNTDDLVVHIRLNNRLVQEKSLMSQIPVSEYKKAFANFKFNKLYIVTDSKEWRYIDKRDVKILRKRRTRFGKKSVVFARTEDTIRYMNELVDGMKEFDPIVMHSSNFIKDFNKIRSFDKIIIHNSTFSWWAATLSNATQIGVYRPWKPAKGKRNKNLGKTNFPGWFSWGKDVRKAYWGHK